MIDIPKDTWSIVLEYLTPIQVIKLEKANKFFKTLVQETDYWKNILFTKIPGSKGHIHKNFKQAYLEVMFKINKETTRTIEIASKVLYFFNIVLGGKQVGVSSLIFKYLNLDSNIQKKKHYKKIMFEEVPYNFFIFEKPDLINDQTLFEYLNGFILCYDVTNQDSLEFLNKFYDSNWENRSIPLIIVGTKSDLNSKISKESLNEILDKFKCEHIEISSQTQNVDVIFDKIIGKYFLTYLGTKNEIYFEPIDVKKKCLLM